MAVAVTGSERVDEQRHGLVSTVLPFFPFRPIARIEEAAASSSCLGFTGRRRDIPPTRMRHALTETKPFFLTSEFFGLLAVLTALAVTAASSDSVDASLFWLLATGIVAAYVFSRGFAKANAPSNAWDPRETLRRSSGRSEDETEVRAPARGERPDYDEEETRPMSTMRTEEYRAQPVYPGWQRGGMMQQFPIETKPFFLTSEFWGTVAIIVGLAIGAGTSEDIDARLFWILATAATIGYVVSRGIAKSGTKSRSWDPREEGMQRLRERGSRGGD
jgi:hypothetical protein